jgi:hypothetical protein
MSLLDGVHEVEPALRCLDRKRLEDAKNGRVDAERDLLDRHATGLNLGDVEDVVDNEEKRGGEVRNNHEILALLAGEAGLGVTPVKPMMPFIGVRTSCDMLARNSDLEVRQLGRLPCRRVLLQRVSE